MINLTTYIEDYQFDTYRKVIIGKEEYPGMIFQKSENNNIQFYRCSAYTTYERYRVQLDNNGKLMLKYLEIYDSENEFDKPAYDCLHDKCKQLKEDKFIDLRNK